MPQIRWRRRSPPAGGADRIELRENLAEGGTTPSYGTIALVRERLRIAVYVLIRPRGGDFVYDDAEREVMRRDVAMCRQLGCDGVVIPARSTCMAPLTKTRAAR